MIFIVITIILAIALFVINEGIKTLAKQRIAYEINEQGLYQSSHIQQNKQEQQKQSQTKKILTVCLIISICFALANIFNGQNHEEEIHSIKEQCDALNIPKQSPIYISCLKAPEQYQAKAKNGELASELDRAANVAAIEAEKKKAKIDDRKACATEKKQGAKSQRSKSLEQLAQDWLQLRSLLIVVPSNEIARSEFKQASQWLEEYPDEAVTKCIDSFQ